MKNKKYGSNKTLEWPVTDVSLLHCVTNVC